MNQKYGSFESAARALSGGARTPQETFAPLTSAATSTGAVSAAPQNALSSASGDGLGASSGDVVQGIQQLASTLGQTSNAQLASVNGLLENTQALTSNTAAVSNQKTSAAGTAGDAVASFLGGGAGISPLLTGLLSLFGLGSQSQTITPELKYAAPPSVNVSGSVGGGGTGGGSSTQAVNIQVNAMDSKSFLDHSEDIAQAVRQAILNSSSLNDAIASL